MRLADGEARLRFGAARVARLATVGPAGAPHVVPVTFVLHGDAKHGDTKHGDTKHGDTNCGDTKHGDYIYSAVDGKPKSSRDLQRLRNIMADPRVAVLADHYEEDWDLLWWVRAEGQATILSGPGEMAGPLRLLAGRYQAYRRHPPAGPVIAVAVRRWSGWAVR